MEKPSSKGITTGKALDKVCPLRCALLLFIFFCLSFVTVGFFLLVCLLSIKAWGSSIRVPRVYPGCRRLWLGWGLLEQSAVLAPCLAQPACALRLSPGLVAGDPALQLSAHFPIWLRTGSDGAVTGLLPELSHAARRIFPPLSRLDYVLSFLLKCQIAVKYRLQQC